MNNEKIEELKKLNEKFYELFGRLHENHQLLNSVKAYEFLGAKIFEQYKAEYELLRIRFESEEKPELYREQVKRNILVPRNRFIFFRNRARKLIYREVMLQLDKYFREREEVLERQTKALELLEKVLNDADRADRSPTVFDEPSEVAEQNDVADNSDGVRSEQTEKADKNDAIRSDGNGQTVGQKPKRTRKKRTAEPRAQEQNTDPQQAQLQGQVSIEELGESAAPKPGNEDKPEQ